MFQHLDHGGATDSGTVRGACEAYVEELKTENSDSASSDAAGSSSDWSITTRSAR